MSEEKQKTEFAIHLSNLICTRMKELNLSYEKVAVKCNTSKQSVIKWANGSIPSSEYIEALCATLKLTPYELLNIKDETKITHEELELLNKLKANPALMDVVKHY